jgi:3-deoxy-D-arabino-heptulosonate 7-phosphate (DAHP) synthase
VSPLNWSDAIFIPRTLFFNIRDIEVGGDEVVIMSGPCSVESEEQIFTVAERSGKVARAFCVAAPLNPAPHRIPSRGSAKRD